MPSMRRLTGAAVVAIASLLGDVTTSHPYTDSENDVAEAVTTDTSEARRQPWASSYVIAVLILAALCAVVGTIYGYIYFTRIKAGVGGHTRSSGRSGDQSGGDKGGADRNVSTHMFLQFKK